MRAIRMFSAQLSFAKKLNDGTYGVRDGSVYRWIETHWELVHPVEVERLAYGWLVIYEPLKCNEKLAASCANTAVLHLPQIPPMRQQTIPLKSGSLELTAAHGIIHRPSCKEDGMTYVLTCEYDPLDIPAAFNEFLCEALPNVEVRDFLQEYAGYTLLSDTRHQLAAWLIGEGSTGKGTFAQLMQSMHRQTVAMSLDALDGFKLAGLQAASLVCVDETPPRIDEQRLKTLISGDVIQIDRKYQDPLTLRPTAKWIVNGNALPAISDHSSGFWRRWLIFPFNVKPAVCRPLLAEAIIEKELSGVLNWCLAGLQRLLQRGKFPQLPDEMVMAANTGKQQSNSVSAWVADVGIRTCDSVRNTRKEIYSLYSQWCSESGTRHVASQKFWERLRQVLPELTEERGMSGGERAFRVNISLPSVND